MLSDLFSTGRDSMTQQESQKSLALSRPNKKDANEIKANDTRFDRGMEASRLHWVMVRRVKPSPVPKIWVKKAAGERIGAKKAGRKKAQEREREKTADENKYFVDWLNESSRGSIILVKEDL